MPPLCLRSKSVVNPFQVRSYEWEENGTYIGVTREEHRSCNFGNKDEISLFIFGKESL